MLLDSEVSKCIIIDIKLIQSDVPVIHHFDMREIEIKKKEYLSEYLYLSTQKLVH